MSSKFIWKGPPDSSPWDFDRIRVHFEGNDVVADPIPWRWLESTDRLQRETYGYGNQYELAHGGDDSVLAPYLDWNQTAAVQELAEVREEFSWKPWAKDEPFVNRERVRDEIIDVLHFLGNMLTAMGVTDEELAEAYQVKQAKNRARAASGSYSAKKGGLGEGSDAG